MDRIEGEFEVQNLHFSVKIFFLAPEIPPEQHVPGA
jgi:hypothetical protein